WERRASGCSRTPMAWWIIRCAAQAAEQGASYKITSAQFNNRVHIFRNQ
ncbi:hypothetical protein Q6284_33415, partial [Klebsiella pneumoniae]|nr:hypothetical protein [Klebsiella pneumoniae]